MKDSMFFKKIEMVFLSLMILSLPSLEAPKNIFLIMFVITALFRRFRTGWVDALDSWSWIFFAIVGTGLLSTIFAGMPSLGEWNGYRVLLTMISVAWLVSIAGYSEKEISWLFGLTIASTIPPLLWGGYELYFLQTKQFLQLHSVGHVNHSAIYLTMIFGASLGWMMVLWARLTLANKILMLLTSSTFFISLIIGQSRAAFGVALLIAFLLIALLKGERRFKIGVIGLLASLSFLAIAFNAEIVNKELTQERNNDFLSGRDKVWNVSLEAARFHPLLGIGMSNWKYITQEDIRKSLESRGKSYNPQDYYTHPGHSHSLYLTALVDRGVVGLATTILFMIFWLRHLIITFRYANSSRVGAFLWSGSFSAWMVTFGIGLVNTTFHHEHGILACLFLAFYLSWCKGHCDLNKAFN